MSDFINDDKIEKIEEEIEEDFGFIDLIKEIVILNSIWSYWFWIQIVLLIVNVIHHFEIVAICFAINIAAMIIYDIIYYFRHKYPTEEESDNESNMEAAKRPKYVIILIFGALNVWFNYPDVSVLGNGIMYAAIAIAAICTILKWTQFREKHVIANGVLLIPLVIFFFYMVSLWGVIGLANVQLDINPPVQVERTVVLKGYDGSFCSREFELVTDTDNLLTVPLEKFKSTNEGDTIVVNKGTGLFRVGYYWWGEDKCGHSYLCNTLFNREARDIVRNSIDLEDYYKEQEVDE